MWDSASGGTLGPTHSEPSAPLSWSHLGLETYASPITDRFARNDRVSGLREGQGAAFRDRGFVAGLDVLSSDDVAELRDRLESLGRRLPELSSELYEIEAAWLERPDETVLHFLAPGESTSCFTTSSFIQSSRLASPMPWVAIAFASGTTRCSGNPRAIPVSCPGIRTTPIGIARVRRPMQRSFSRSTTWTARAERSRSFPGAIGGACSPPRTSAGPATRCSHIWATWSAGPSSRPTSRCERVRAPSITATRCTAPAQTALPARGAQSSSTTWPTAPACSTIIPPYFYIRNDKAVTPPTGRIEANYSQGWSKIQGAFWRAGGIAPDLQLKDVLPRFTDEAIDVIQDHVAENKQATAPRPLMLYLAYPAPHTPWLPAREFRDGAAPACTEILP